MMQWVEDEVKTLGDLKRLVKRAEELGSDDGSPIIMNDILDTIRVRYE